MITNEQYSKWKFRSAGVLLKTIQRRTVRKMEIDGYAYSIY
jgi:hypothetical protein